MDTMTKKERVRATLAGEAADRPPAALWGHDFLREWDARGLVAATVEDYRANDWDFIKFNPRATYFAEAWGNHYERPREQRQPRQSAAAVANAAALSEVEAVDGRAGVFAEHLYALRLLVDEVGGEVDVVHTVFSPLGVAGLLCGPRAEFREFALANPAGAHTALAAITETLAGYCEASIEAGASGIFFAPLGWASHNIADEAFYREFGRPYDLQVLETVREAPFNILHVCRDHNMIDLVLDYPVAAFNWADRGAGNPSLADIRERTGKPVMGGIDQVHLHDAPVDVVASQAREALAANPRQFFLTAGCSIPPATPRANRAAVAAAARWG